MIRRNQELWYALAAIAGVTVVYLAAYQFAGALPAASSFVGHWTGVLGFVLMLMTETVYSIRKQTTVALWGSMAGWLRLHVVTGLVGPYMVLLHSAMKFKGLAGVAMLLTAIVVVSGVVGRYLYTALPRTMDGVESEPDATGSLAGRLVTQRKALATWRSIHIPLTWALFALALVHSGAALYYATLQR